MRFRVKIAGTHAEIHEIVQRGLVPPYMWNSASRYEDDQLGPVIEINETAPGQIGTYSVQAHRDPRHKVPVVSAAAVLGRE